MFRRTFLVMSIALGLVAPLPALAKDGEGNNPPKPREGEEGNRKESDGNKGTRVTGKVKSIDGSAGTITLEGRKKEGVQVQPEQTFVVTNGASIKVNGKAAGLDGIPVGSQALVVLNAAGEATAITVGGGKEGKEVREGGEGGGDGNKPPKREGGEGERKRG